MTTWLNGATIGLDAVVSVSPAAVKAALSDLARGFQFADGRRITPVLVNGHHVWRPVIRICRRRFEELLRGFAIPRLRQIEVNRLPASTARNRYIHLARYSESAARIDSAKPGSSVHFLNGTEEELTPPAYQPARTNLQRFQDGRPRRDGARAAV